MSFRIAAQPKGSLYYALMIYDADGTFIGEYEDSIASNIDRKTREVLNAERDLRRLFDRHGTLQVRWSGAERRKVVRDAAGREVGEVHRSHWEDSTSSGRTVRLDERDFGICPACSMQLPATGVCSTCDD